MKDVVPEGHYYLTPGVRLIPKDDGGVVLQMSPLRAMRINGAAFQLLRRCREGLSPGDCIPKGSICPSQALLSFLDSLCATQLLRWKPARLEPSPFVSVVVPVYNRQEEIGACIESLLRLNYPPDRLEIIVVDDASEDGTAAATEKYDVTVLTRERNLGQSAARNSGVAFAKGDIVAFIDSDCIADPDWLSELTPYFRDPGIALVGGYVASHYRESWLDRYEDAKSPLNMGSHPKTCCSMNSDFYVPTCNMLVRKDVYREAGGLDESWRVGEDVDLCWRIKKTGMRLIYVPEGKVRHKHRNGFLQTLMRRFDYGTSEPALYQRHREVSKRFPWRPFHFLFCLSLFLGLLTGAWFFAFPALCTVVLEACHKKAEMRKKVNVSLPSWEIMRSIVKDYAYLAYHMSSYLVRYYLLFMIPLTLLFPFARMLCLGTVLFAVTGDFLRVRPRLPFPQFMFYYLMEQAFYQGGVIAGCIRLRSVRCYGLHLSHTRTARRQPAGWIRRMFRSMGDLANKNWNRKDPLRHNS
jgi:mycofactocin system glycosyltransferase